MSDKKITILIIDDELLSRATLEALLETEGYTLVLAEDGQQGLEKVKTFKPDLVIVDVMMPGISGFEVCRRLRASPEFQKLPIIMITAWQDDNARTRCLELGADEVICKPFDRTDLNARVRYLLQQT